MDLETGIWKLGSWIWKLAFGNPGFRNWDLETGRLDLETVITIAVVVLFWGLFGPQAGGNGGGRGLEGFLVSVAPSSPSMSPWGAMGTLFMPFFI